MKTSVVSCTYNKPLQTLRGLVSLINQEVVPKELILVDDGSSPSEINLEQKLEDACLLRGINFKYIYLDDHPEPRISCYPRNVGFKHSHGDVVMFVEPEVLHVGPTFQQLLDKMGEFPDRTPVATQVWTIQQKIYQKLSDEHFQYPARILSHEYAQLTDNANLQNTKAPDSDWAITGSRNCLTGCFFAVERIWFEDIGGFDEDFTGFAWDDFDLFARLGKYGKGILPCDDIVVIHQWHPKNYPYNIYEAGERNGKKSETRIKTGEFRANIGKNWGRNGGQEVI